MNGEPHQINPHPKIRCMEVLFIIASHAERPLAVGLDTFEGKENRREFVNLTNGVMLWLHYR